MNSTSVLGFDEQRVRKVFLKELREQQRKLSVQIRNAASKRGPSADAKVDFALLMLEEYAEFHANIFIRLFKAPLAEIRSRIKVYENMSSPLFKGMLSVCSAYWPTLDGQAAKIVAAINSQP